MQIGGFPSQNEYKLLIFNELQYMRPSGRSKQVKPGQTSLCALEWYNPFGSVKDRAAWSMLRQLETEGKVGPGRNAVEPTSGNTGLSLASMASVRGYKLRAVVPRRIPQEKKVLLKIAGADLEVLNDDVCPAPGLGEGSINRAKSHAKASPDEYVLPNRYENEANVQAHMRTTGPEIWRQTEGKTTHFFAALGTCGTVTGTGRFLKSNMCRAWSSITPNLR